MLGVVWLEAARIGRCFALLVLLAYVPPAYAAFHFAAIDEVMTSYNGDATVQFVEIRMIATFQILTTDTVLGAFDATGVYLGDVLIVPGDITNHGPGVPWLMATTQFQTLTGLVPDFVMPAGLPIGGGMVCWGAPGAFAPAPGTWDHTDPSLYVDCLAYGSYSGPTNVHIGTPTTLLPEGHSLQRTTDTNNNAADFVCSDPATPTNNTEGESAGGVGLVPYALSAPLVATSPCSGCGNNVVEAPFEDCDGADDAACPGACLPDCTCSVCGNLSRGPAEDCDGTDDVACPGLCDLSCLCPEAAADDDNDGVRDAEDPCTTLGESPGDPPTSPPGQTPAKSTIILKDLDKPGFEDLLAKGFFNPSTETPDVDPQTNGVHVRLTNAGNVLLDVTIPGDQDVLSGDYSKGTKLCGDKRDGWLSKETSSGVKLWKYLNKSGALPPDCSPGSAEGIALVLIKKIPNRSAFLYIVKTKDQPFAVDPEPPPISDLQMSLALAGEPLPGIASDEAILGQCVETTILPGPGDTTVGTGPAKPFCKASPKEAVPPNLKKIICKGL